MQRPRMIESVLGAIFLCTLLAGGLCLLRPPWLFDWPDFRTGNEIISRVEAFRTRNGKLPENLVEVGIKDPDLQVFYCKDGPNEYRVWFGSILGESETYDSHSKDWGLGRDRPCLGQEAR